MITAPEHVAETDAANFLSTPEADRTPLGDAIAEYAHSYRDNKLEELTNDENEEWITIYSECFKAEVFSKLQIANDYCDSCSSVRRKETLPEFMDCPDRELFCPNCESFFIGKTAMEKI